MTFFGNIYRILRAYLSLVVLWFVKFEHLCWHDGDQPDDRCEQAVAAAVGCPGGQGDDGEEPAPCGGQCPGIVHPSYRIWSLSRDHSLKLQNCKLFFIMICPDSNNDHSKHNPYEITLFCCCLNATFRKYVFHSVFWIRICIMGDPHGFGSVLKMRIRIHEIKHLK